MRYDYSTAAAHLTFPEGVQKKLVSDFLDNLKAYTTLSKRTLIINVDEFIPPLTATLIVEDRLEVIRRELS